MNKKWFYPLQNEAYKILSERYSEMGLCLYQSITKDKVFEAFRVQKSDGSTATVLSVLLKNGAVEIFESKGMIFIK